MNSHKKTPPYGKQLSESFRKMKRLPREIKVIVGDRAAWRLAENKRCFGEAVLLIPQTAQPQDYDWGLVRNKEVLVIVKDEISYQFVRRLAFELLMAGAFVVRAISSMDGLVIFRRYGGNND